MGSASDGVDGDVDESRSVEWNLAQRDMADAIDVGSGTPLTLPDVRREKRVYNSRKHLPSLR
jgi:hypothetical protein